MSHDDLVAQLALAVVVVVGFFVILYAALWVTGWILYFYRQYKKRREPVTYVRRNRFNGPRAFYAYSQGQEFCPSCDIRYDRFYMELYYEGRCDICGLACHDNCLEYDNDSNAVCANCLEID